MITRSSLSAALVGAFLSFICIAVTAQPMLASPQGAPAFWKVEGEHNTLWLLGTVHVLTKDHYPLAAPVEDAFAASPVLVVEADVLNSDPMAMQQALMRTGTFPAGQNLQAFLGGETYQQVSQLASGHGYNLVLMQNMRPWLVAMMVAMGEAAKLGYTPDQGVDMYFLNRANGAKTILPLETVEQQLQIFANMSPEVEKDQLLQTFEQLDELKLHLHKMMTAWESGDLAALEKVLTEEFAEYPELYDALVTTRNEDWAKKLAPILRNSKEDHFMAVGALHLVGDDSLVDMLREQGYTVTQQ